MRPVDFLSPPDWAFESNELGVRVTRRSLFSKKLNSMVLPVTQARIERWAAGGGEVVQNAFPELNADQREFLMSGATPEEWKEIFG